MQASVQSKQKTDFKVVCIIYVPRLKDAKIARGLSMQRPFTILLCLISQTVCKIGHAIAFEHCVLYMRFRIEKEVKKEQKMK